MTKTYALSNGDKATIEYNAYMNDYVAHLYTGGSVYGLGRHKTLEEAEAKMVRRLSRMGVTITEA